MNEEELKIKYIKKYFTKGKVPFENKEIYYQYNQIINEGMYGNMCTNYNKKKQFDLPKCKSILLTELNGFKNSSKLFDTIINFHNSKYSYQFSYNDIKGEFGAGWFILDSRENIVNKNSCEYIENIIIYEYESSGNTYNKYEVIILKHNSYNLIKYKYEYQNNDILDVKIVLSKDLCNIKNIDKFNKDIKDTLFLNCNNININYTNRYIPMNTIGELNNKLKTYDTIIKFDPLKCVGNQYSYQSFINSIRIMFLNDNINHDKIDYDKIALKNNLTEEQIFQLTQDEKYNVRYNIGEMIQRLDNLSDNLILIISNDEYVARFIAKRKELSIEVIEILSNSSDLETLSNLIDRNDLSEDILLKLAHNDDQDGNHFIPHSISMKDNLSEDVIKVLITYKDYEPYWNFMVRSLSDKNFNLLKKLLIFENPKYDFLRLSRIRFAQN